MKEQADDALYFGVEAECVDRFVVLMDVASKVKNEETDPTTRKS